MKNFGKVFRMTHPSRLSKPVESERERKQSNDAIRNRKCTNDALYVKPEPHLDIGIYDDVIRPKLTS